MLTISMLIDNLNIHGGVRRCLELSSALIMRGHRVSIHVPGGTWGKWLRCLAPVWSWESVPDRPDALVLFGFSSDYLAVVENAQPRMPVFYSVSLNEREPEAMLTSTASKSVRWRATIQDPRWLILACSTWITDWIRANLRPDAEPLIGAVNRTIFHPVPVKHADHPVILTSGDPRAREGSIAVFGAVDLLRKECPNVELRTYHKAGHAQDKMAEVYCAADLFLDGQWYAGWANAVAEAMACGVPVVCTDIGGVKDFARHDETALLAPVEDREALAAYAWALLSNPELAGRLRANALQQIGQFTYAAMAERFERLVQERL